MDWNHAVAGMRPATCANYDYGYATVRLSWPPSARNALI